MKVQVDRPQLLSPEAESVHMALYFDFGKVKRGVAPWNLHYGGNIIAARSIQLDVNTKVHEDGHLSFDGQLWMVGENKYWVQV